MYERFGLVLMVTHGCNLRCSYCYTGEKSARVMTEGVGRRAIERAMASIKRGGSLELGFFGGEPLGEAALVGRLLEFARVEASGRGIRLHLSLTTNGTVDTPAAWDVMMEGELDLAVSFDGVPEVHDRHRRWADGRGSSGRVLGTIGRLVGAGKDFRVVMVVRPDTVERLAEGIGYLRGLGVRHVEPALDLWAQWTEESVERLGGAIRGAAKLWREGLPVFSVGWFDEKAAFLSGVPIEATARCLFGAGEIAVAPSGTLYPCERLIGEDRTDNPMRLGEVSDGVDFLALRPAPAAMEDEECRACTMRRMCNTTCRCGNYVRSGDVATPDGLLCAWNQACLTETARVLGLIGGEEDEPQRLGGTESRE